MVGVGVSVATLVALLLLTSGDVLLLFESLICCFAATCCGDRRCCGLPFGLPAPTGVVVGAPSGVDVLSAAIINDVDRVPSVGVITLLLFVLVVFDMRNLLDDDLKKFLFALPFEFFNLRSLLRLFWNQTCIRW